MARQAVVDAIEAHIASWTGAPIFGENEEGQTPQDSSPFIVVQYPFVTSHQITVGAPGANLWRDDGAFRIVIHARRGGGLAQARQWADELADLFRGKDLGAVRTWAPSAPVTDDRNPRASYYILSFACPYQHDYSG